MVVDMGNYSTAAVRLPLGAIGAPPLPPAGISGPFPTARIGVAPIIGENPNTWGTPGGLTPEQEAKYWWQRGSGI